MSTGEGLTPEQFRRVEDLFHQLIQQSQSERDDELATLAHAEPEVHAELMALLEEEAGARAGDISQLAAHIERLRDPDLDGATPAIIGPYRLLRLLGQGGMGLVYEAEQTEPVKRTVALKLIKWGMNTASIVARFHSERQALAVMEHPHIARVFDAGATEDGRPYFVMELVEGQPLTDFCDRHRLDINQRLDLFAGICDAVHHAHQKGIIHRDLKPSNILVTEQDGTPQPKIIDFGIAKATAQEMVEQTLFTRLGELIGTPEYMSPEQASLGELDIDTRSDVYALGLILFELLVGALPTPADRLRGIGLDEMRRRIREDPTPRPSTRLDTLAEARPQIFEARRTQASGLVRRLKGDLDWIVLRALAKDRNERYDSAAELAADVPRHLVDEPVSAGPPSLRYQVRKFVRRHRVVVTAAASVALAVVVGLVFSLFSLDRALDAEQRALTNQATAEETSDFLVELFQVENPNVNPGENLTAREVLEKGVERIDQLDDQPEVQLRLLSTLGEVYWGLGLYEEGAELLERARELRREAGTTLSRGMVDDLNRLAGHRRDQGQLDEAEALYQQALEIAEQVSPGNDQWIGGIQNNLGMTLRHQGRFDEARELLVAALESTRAVESESRLPEASLLNNLATTSHALGDFAAARDFLIESIELFEAELPPNHPNIAILSSNLCGALKRLGQLQEAFVACDRSIAIDRETLGEEHPALADGLMNRASVTLRMGVYDQTNVDLLECIEINTARLGAEAFRGLHCRWALANLRLFEGRLDEAGDRYQQVLGYLERSEHPRADRERIGALRALSVVRRLQGQLDEADRLALANIELAERLDLGLHDPYVSRVQRAIVAVQRGELAEGQRLYEEAESLAQCSGACSLDSPSGWVMRASYWAQLRVQDPSRQEAVDEMYRLLDYALEHPDRALWVVDCPDFETFRSEPRFAEFEERVRAQLGV